MCKLVLKLNAGCRVSYENKVGFNMFLSWDNIYKIQSKPIVLVSYYPHKQNIYLGTGM